MHLIESQCPGPAARSLCSCSHEEMEPMAPSLTLALSCDLLLPIEHAGSSVVIVLGKASRNFASPTSPFLEGALELACKEAWASRVDDERPRAGELRLPAASQHPPPVRMSDDVIPEEPPS